MLVTAAAAALAPAADPAATPPSQSRPPPAAGALSIVVDPPTEDTASIEAADLDLHDTGAATVGTLTLTVTSSRSDDTAHVTLSLPHGARVVGMTYQGATSDYDPPASPIVARALTASRAHQDFTLASEPLPLPIRRDPALLEHTRDSPAYDRYRLAVYPVSIAEHATVIVMVAMPRFDRLLVATPRGRQDLLGRDLPRATGVDELLAARPSALATGAALYAEPVPPRATADTLARLFDSVRGDLEDCAGVDSHDADQDVALHFVVSPGGRAKVTATDGAGPQLAACVRIAIEHTRFLGEGDPLAVDYALHVAAPPAPAIDMATISDE